MKTWTGAASGQFRFDDQDPAAAEVVSFAKATRFLEKRPLTDRRTGLIIGADIAIAAALPRSASSSSSTSRHCTNWGTRWACRIAVIGRHHVSFDDATIERRFGRAGASPVGRRHQFRARRAFGAGPCR
jgi:hypothetical protein